MDLVSGDDEMVERLQKGDDEPFDLIMEASKRRKIPSLRNYDNANLKTKKLGKRPTDLKEIR